MDPYNVTNFTERAFHPPRGEQWFGPHAILIIQIAIIALALLVMWWILRDHYKRGSFNKNDKPIDILNKRYAAGELTKDEYERIRKDIG